MTLSPKAKSRLSLQFNPSTDPFVTLVEVGAGRDAGEFAFITSEGPWSTEEELDVSLTRAEALLIRNKLTSILEEGVEDDY